MSRELPDIESLLYEALKLGDPQERQAYLEAACGVGTTLRTEIDSLLRAYESGTDVLKAPADLLSEPADTLMEGAGEAIGRYRLLEKIGEGGMAVVYMAEQERPIRRRVALKIIKLGMDTESVIARFEAERQALAMMDHPNIAKVFDAGSTDTGRPYFVMELVRGVSITAYCDQERLGSRERLELFAKVCSAVQHAHQRGIIHRDLKPSNVMVTMHDDEAVPKIIDFGIAKATKQRLTEKTLFTRYAQIVGTPAYMSPEQAQMSDLDIDTRSDIYSLGVLLYELLTGTAPFAEEELRQAGYAEMQRIICEEEPVKPSTKLSTLGETLTEIAKQRCATPESLRKTMRGDLDWIVMKSLEKNRARRYETASSFKRDIQRYLQHEPVHAHRPSAAYRLQKYLYRHRVHAIAALVALVLVSTIITVIAVTKADREQLADAERAAHENSLFQAREFWVNGERQLALNQVEPLLQSPHVGPDARLLYAGLLVDDGHVEEATHVLAGLFNEESEIAGTAHALMVRLLWENQAPNDPEALKAIEEHKQQAKALLPEDAESCFVRALTSLTIKEKLTWLDQALALDRRHYESRKLRALIYQASRKYQELKDDAELLIFQKAKEPLGYELLATALENLDDDSGAVAQYDRAINLVPTDDPRHLDWTKQRCDVLLRVGDYERVIADVEAYRDQTPSEMMRNTSYLDFCVFYALTGLGQYDQAEALHQRIAGSVVRANPQMKIRGRFRGWSTRHIFDDLEAGRSWHAPGRIPQGAAFDAMHEAEDTYHHLRARAAPLLRGFSPAWSPDGTKLAFSLGTYGISGVAVHDFTSQETELLITPGSRPSWSPDGRYITFVRDRQSLRFSTLVTSERHYKFAYRRFEEIWIMEADGSKPRRICTGTFPSWSQEDPNVIYYYSNADLMLYALAVDDPDARPRPLHVCTNWCSQQSYNLNLPLNVSPDERYMAKVGINALEIVERGEKETTICQWIGLGEIFQGNWAPSSRRFSLGGGDFGLWIFDLDTREAALVLRSNGVGGAAWSPDEKALAIAFRQPAYEIWLATFDDPTISTIDALGGGLSIEDFHQDRVALCSQRVAADPNDGHWYLERAFHHHILGDEEQVLQDMENYVATARRSEAGHPGEENFRDFLRRVWRATPVNLGPPVNSRYNENYANVSHDGLSLYFSSDRPDGRGQKDLWVTRRTSIDEPWPEPENLGPTINTPFYEFAPSLSRDGLSLYFGSTRSDGEGRRGIWVSKRKHKDAPWGTPECLGPSVTQSGRATSASISADGLELYYSATWIGNWYGDDIWVTTRATTESPWGQPRNLGPVVNSTWSDYTPSLSPDGLMLFYRYCWYGRDRRQIDVWVTTRASKEDPWTTPVNLGPTVNTYGWERSVSMTADGSLLYFVSDRDGTVGAQDIWEIRLSKTVESD